MPPPLYTQTVIAFIWDYDRTLIPSNQQDALFEAFDVDGKNFWREVDGLVDHYRSMGIGIARDTAYLNHILTYVDEGIFAGLTREKLHELGRSIETCEGIPEFFDATRSHVASKPAYVKEGITVEHYVVSTGIQPMIEGSPIAPISTAFGPMISSKLRPLRDSWTDSISGRVKAGSPVSPTHSTTPARRKQSLRSTKASTRTNRLM